MGSTKNKKVDLSPREKELFGLLPNGSESISSKQLIAMLSDKPYNARQTVTATMGSLSRKMDYNHDFYRIVKTPRAGPKHTEYRKVKR